MTLCIVDMQPKFASSMDVVSQVVEETRKAIERREPIVVVEYGPEGHPDSHTYPEIMNLVKGYARQTTIHKYVNGGGNELVQALKALNFNRRRIRFTGVNACACVWATFEETHSLLTWTRFEIITGAISCTCNSNICFNKYQDMKRTKLLEKT